MEFRCWRSCLIAVAALLVASVSARSATLCAPERDEANAPLSERVVAYQIEGRYDARTHTLDATELLTYTNQTGVQLDHFPFHLYLNAFQPKSTFMTEAERNGQRDAEKGAPWNSKHFGSNTVKSLEIVGAGGSSQDVTRQMKFICAR